MPAFLHIMECLTNILGITRTPCECIADDLPEGYTESKSGLYLDELPQFPLNLKDLKSIDECGRDLPALLQLAMDNAVTQFRKDLFKLLQTRYKSNIREFDGTVGSQAYTGVLGLSEAYAGVQFKTVPVKGGVLSIARALVALNTTATFDLLVYSNGVLLQTIALASQAGSTKDNVFPEVKLPLADSDGGSITYSFIYQRNGMQPKNNEVSCNCGDKERQIKKYLTVTGIVGNDPGQLASFTNTKYVNGILLNIDIRCDADDTFCGAYSENRFVQVAVDYALLQKSVELLIVGMLNSKTINRETMANREQMQHNAWALAKKFNNDVQWISENLDLSESECFTCNKENDAYRKAGIRL